ncbi:hypothetical protein [Kineosporia sp. R_H_3]|uniref:hypothetical protein n=1 Tax=Kineosporia sp. R_H_3 TaxID=1961848 RepID=UPI000B4BFC11|nr:hypothetical protein [Kineosporia sp. R_H_3]
MNDHDLRLLVRDSLTERAEALPAVTPPWDRVRGGMSGVRRRRRRRQALVGGVVALLAVLGAVRVDVGPLRADRTAVTPPDGGRVRASAIFPGPTVGSLAGDRAFVEEVRRRVLATGRFLDEPVAAATVAADVLVPFAGDVGDLRLVLVEVELGTSATDTFLWFDAPRGAPAAEIMAGDPLLTSAELVTSVWLPSPQGRAAEQGTGALVVLSALKGDVKVATGLTWSADGTPTWDVRTVEPAAGQHRELAVPWRDPTVPPGLYTVPGDAGWITMEPAGAGGPPEVFLDGLEPALHGGRAATGFPVARAVGAAQMASGVVRDRSTRRLLWTGLDGKQPLSVVAVTVPSGAHVVTAVREIPETGSPDGYTGSQVTVAVPAGPLDRVAVAFALEESDPADGTTGVAVLGPVGATTATVTDEKGGRTTERLVDGFASLRVRAPETVEFTDAAGTTVGRAPVVTGAPVAPPQGG